MRVLTKAQTPTHARYESFRGKGGHFTRDLLSDVSVPISLEGTFSH